MHTTVGTDLTAEGKGAAFAAYLDEIGLPSERVLGGLGPAEVGDVVSFFYAGMPDRFKDSVADNVSAHDGALVSAEQSCVPVRRAEDHHRLIA